MYYKHNPILRIFVFSSLHLLCLFSQSYGQNPSDHSKTDLLHGNEDNSKCGICPTGYERIPSDASWCGPCKLIEVLCESYLSSVPCPPVQPVGDLDTSRDRFGTGCFIDASGNVICNCSDEYTGKDCNECAPGYIQDQDSKNCIQSKPRGRSIQIPANEVQDNSCLQIKSNIIFTVIITFVVLHL